MDNKPTRRKAGNPNIKQVQKRFSSTYQPENYRTSTKPLTDLLKKNLEGPKEIVVEGELLEFEKDKDTYRVGDRVNIRVSLPTKDILIASLLRKAAKGDLKAIDMIMDRIEGKPFMKFGFGEMGGGDEPPPQAGVIIFSDGRKEIIQT